MTIEDFRTKWNKACLASNISNGISYCMQQPLSNVLTDIHIQKINNSMKLKYILSESVIEWQVGTPIKSEQYL